MLAADCMLLYCSTVERELVSGHEKEGRRQQQRFPADETRTSQKKTRPNVGAVSMILNRVVHQFVYSTDSTSVAARLLRYATHIDGQTTTERAHDCNTQHIRTRHKKTLCTRTRRSRDDCDGDEHTRESEPKREDQTLAERARLCRCREGRNRGKFRGWELRTLCVRVSSCVSVELVCGYYGWPCVRMCERRNTVYELCSAAADTTTTTTNTATTTPHQQKYSYVVQNTVIQFGIRMLLCTGMTRYAIVVWEVLISSYQINKLYSLKIYRVWNYLSNMILDFLYKLFCYIHWYIYTDNNRLVDKHYEFVAIYFYIH